MPPEIIKDKKEKKKVGADVELGTTKVVSKKTVDVTKIVKTFYDCGTMFIVNGKAAILCNIGHPGWEYDEDDEVWYNEETDDSRENEPSNEVALFNLHTGTIIGTPKVNNTSFKVPYEKIQSMTEYFALPIKEHKITYA